MFFHTKVPIIKLLNDFTDYHSHILPGVDDGVESVSEALQILSNYEKHGVKRVIFTPHIMEDYPHNNPSFLQKEFHKFKEIYNGNIELSLAAEYMLDRKFFTYLDESDLLPLFDNYLLIETSCVEPILDFKNILNDIMSRGYFVVLAHPERYSFLSCNEYEELKYAGILFQLNIPALLGCYGYQVKNRAKWLLKNNLYDLTGLDIHSYDHYSNIFDRMYISKSLAKSIAKINFNKY